MDLTKVRFVAKKILSFLEGSEHHETWKLLLLDLNKDLFREEALLKMKQMCSPTWLGELYIADLPRGKWEWQKILDSLLVELNKILL